MSNVTRRNVATARKPPAPPPAPVPAASPPPPPISRGRRPFSYSDPRTWTLLSPRWYPAYVVGVATLAAVYWFLHAVTPGLDLTTYGDCADTFDYGFAVNAVVAQARTGATRGAWEFAAAHEALTLVRNPERGVFGAEPFPGGKVPGLGYKKDWTSDWASSAVRAEAGWVERLGGEGSVAGNASVGVAAVLLGQRWKEWMVVAERLKGVVVEGTPRWANGAIGWGATAVVELRAEAVGMIPPFLAYYGVATNDLSLVREAVKQIELYREVLQITKGTKKGLWKHSVTATGGGDDGAWGTANGAAAYGMVKTRAIVAAWPKSSATMTSEVAALDAWIGEIIDAAVRSGDGESQLLRNYLGDKSSMSDTSGTSLIVATLYRMAVIQPQRFAKDSYLKWAGQKRRAIAERIDEDGYVRSAANPYDTQSTTPIDVSPEGQSYILLMGTAWRDSVCARIGLDGYLEETGEELARWVPLGEIFSIDSLTGGYLSRVSKYLSKP